MTLKEVIENSVFPVWAKELAELFAKFNEAIDGVDKVTVTYEPRSDHLELVLDHRGPDKGENQNDNKHQH